MSELPKPLPSLFSLAVACKRSYQDAESFGDEALRVKTRDGWTIIAIRGSDSLDDWISNFRFSPDDGIHDGFQAGTDELLDRVVQEVIKTRRPEANPVILTGHSRGGALAEILAVNLGLPCVTFGAPRTFSAKFLRDLRAVREEMLPGVSKLPALRCVAPGDPVPYFPPLLASYRHRSRAVLLTKKGPKIRPSVLGALSSFALRWRTSVSNHSIDNYVRLASRVTTKLERLVTTV